MQCDEYIMHVKNRSHIHVFVQKDTKSHLEEFIPNSYLEKRRGMRLRMMCEKDFRCICNALNIVKTFDKHTYLMTSVLYYFTILKGIY